MTGWAAVFDLDNTLVRGSSLFHFGVFMARRRLVPPRHVLRFALDEATYVVRRRERDGISASIAERTLGLVRGIAQDELLRYAALFAEKRLDAILVSEVAARAAEFRRSGYTTVIATASPQELASAIAERLGFCAAVGTMSETVNGRYSGRLSGPITHGYAKAARVAELLGELDLEADGSWAFSDSVNDLPLLTMVGFPVPTDPDEELAAIARTNGWPILRPVGRREPVTRPMESLYPYAR